MAVLSTYTINKEVTLDKAMSFIDDGCTLMVGGFAASGSPMTLIKGLMAKGVKDLTLIANDTGYADRGVGLMVVANQIKKAIVSHIGTNAETVRMFAEDKIEVELVPQGTLVECIRSGGYGLGGVLTPTGLGTEIETGKQKIEVDGKLYLLEKPLKADVAIIKAKMADRMGNLVCHGSNTAHDVMMATAAKITIAEVDEIVETGALDPDKIHIQSVFVNYIVKGV
jgi:acetate CoA/acetoacetate CoA-transferase alpha subunit